MLVHCDDRSASLQLLNMEFFMNEMSQRLTRMLEAKD